MEVSYRRDTYHSYMVVAGSEEEETDDEEKMMSNQNSSVLLSFHVQQLNGKKDYYYDITGKLDFRSYIEKQQADFMLIDAVIHFLIEICHAVNEYLLNPDGILMDPSCVYMDIDEHKLYAAYVPGMQEEFNSQLRRFASCLLENTNHKDKEGVLLSYNFYKIVRREDFSPGLLTVLCQKKQEKEIDSIFQDAGGERTQSDIWRDSDREEEEQAEGKEKQEKNKTKGHFFKQIVVAGICLSVLLLYKAGYTADLLEVTGLGLDAGYVTIGGIVCGAVIVMLIGRPEWKIKFPVKTDSEDQDVWDDKEFRDSGVYSFTDETVYNSDYVHSDKTMMLSGADGTVRLISLNKNVAADLIITHFPCVAGSRESEGQLVISAVGISRRHALFEKKEDGIYLTDLNSTNGTMVNGEKLINGEKRKLLVEDIVEFADVRYMYCGGGIGY